MEAVDETTGKLNVQRAHYPAMALENNIEMLKEKRKCMVFGFSFYGNAFENFWGCYLSGKNVFV